MTRNNFLKQAALSAGGLAVLPAFTNAVPAVAPIAPEQVQEFVGVAHRDLVKVKELLEATPHLLHASWDWGDGDFETALGAAGHVGNHDIALYLIEKGARADIFVLTMLGKTELVKAILEAYPVLLHSTGPHGYTLLHHAMKGGEPAKALYDYLTEKGLQEMRVMMYKK
jgi:hypothetical protein